MDESVHGCGLAISRHYNCLALVREQILRHGLIDPARLVQAPCGVAPEFSPTPADIEIPQEAASAIAGGFLLHVGSCIPRKRIDVLLDVFARCSKDHPELWLIQVGGEWTPEQSRQIQRLGIGSRAIQLSRLERPALAELYRKSRLVLMTSEAEGFGLPLVEALACGAIVIASDIGVFREVAGGAAIYCRLADVEDWHLRIRGLLSGAEVPPPLQMRLEWARQYSWAAHANIIANTYRRFVAAEHAEGGTLF